MVCQGVCANLDVYNLDACEYICESSLIYASYVCESRCIILVLYDDVRI